MKKKLAKLGSVIFIIIFIVLMFLCIRISKQRLLGEYIFKLLQLNLEFDKIFVAIIVLGSKYFSGMLSKKYNFKKISNFGDISFKYLAYVVVISTILLFF
ncbi:hypothetical protein G9F73_019665 [Clostridium estertheticum]|uniref:hypothetical protein n=1 Tax=Clostridium estertheticum TaxID=238834 RepID=UPI0013EE9CBA|nr:hypothetical protein [Clostridium estertheticum]MBZ9609945.1 hypothetical protein [Clostridium estertheticum]